MKRAPGRARRSIHDVADELDYTCGEFTLRRMAEVSRVVRAKLDDMERFDKCQDAKDKVFAEAADLMRLEREWIDYFEPKKRSVESNLNVSGELTLFDLLTRDRSGDDSATGS